MIKKNRFYTFFDGVFEAPLRAVLKGVLKSRKLLKITLVLYKKEP